MTGHRSACPSVRFHSETLSVFNPLRPDSDQAGGDPGSVLLSDDDSHFLLSVFFRRSEDSTNSSMNKLHRKRFVVTCGPVNRA